MCRCGVSPLLFLNPAAGPWSAGGGGGGGTVVLHMRPQYAMPLQKWHILSFSITSSSSSSNATVALDSCLGHSSLHVLHYSALAYIRPAKQDMDRVKCHRISLLAFAESGLQQMLLFILAAIS